MSSRFIALVAACVLLCASPPGITAMPQQVDPFITEGGIRDIKISPTGEYLAMSVRMDGQTSLVVRKTRGDGKPTGVMRFTRNTHVHDFWWVNGERIVMSIAETFGTRDDPVPTGELYAMNADGGRRQLLVGFRATGPQFGSRIGLRKEGDLAAFLIDTLPHDRDHVLVKLRPFTKDPVTYVARLNVYDGRRTRVTAVSVLEADYMTDSRGRVRFGVGSMSDNYSQLFHRKDDDSPWELVNHERESGSVMRPIGFAADDVTAYLRVTQPSGPDRIIAWNTDTGERREVAGDDVVDPFPVYDPGTGRSVPVISARVPGPGSSIHRVPRRGCSRCWSGPSRTRW